MPDPLVASLSPQAHDIRIFWAGTEGVRYELETEAPTVPLNTAWSSEVSRLKGDVRGVRRQEKPEPTFSFTAMWYGKQPGDPALHDAVTNTGTGLPTPTNANARPGVGVESAIRCYDCWVEVGTGIEGGPVVSYYCPATELQPQAPATDNLGTKVQYQCIIHGDIVKTEIIP